MRLRILAIVAIAAAGIGLASAPSHAFVQPTTGISFTSSTLAKVGAVTTLSVAVSASDGVTQPVGAVVFHNSDGVVMGTSATSPGTTPSSAVASITWVPTAAKTYTFVATYAPATGTLLAGSTTGAPITVTATPSGQLVSIAAHQMYLGVPTTVTATITPSTLQGSVAFTVNGYGIGPSMPVVNGAASFTFTPGAVGWQQYGVSFTATNATANGAAAQWVNVLPAQGPNRIALSPTPTTMANGTSVALTVTTTTGATATTSATGGCTLTGTTLTATSGSGSCLVTASSPSSGGYLGITSTWSVTLTPGVQTATVAAPPSGRLAIGRTVTLSTAGTRTNAGQQISWKVTRGKAACSVRTTAAGAARLTMNAAGTCRVRGSAPAVSGQWGAYSVGRSYRAG